MRGDPMSPLRWTCKGLQRPADHLRKLGREISLNVVGVATSYRVIRRSDRGDDRGSFGATA